MTVVSWGDIQNEISSCISCSGRISGATINCPPDILYPEPPSDVRILFVGVAPPRRYSHFYANEPDKLRIGLFRLLEEFGYRNRTVSDFISNGFYLSHTAKCSYKESPMANTAISLACTPKFLKREIEVLKPKNVCILSMKVGPKICTELVSLWGEKLEVIAHVPSQIKSPKFKGKLVYTAQPVRGNEKRTRIALQRVFAN